jgi:hypothetical protein
MNPMGNKGKMITAVLDGYDGDECEYQKVGESDADYKARMALLDAKLDARMSDDEKRLVEELVRGFDECVEAIESGAVSVW